MPSGNLVDDRSPLQEEKITYTNSPSLPRFIGESPAKTEVAEDDTDVAKVRCDDGHATVTAVEGTAASSRESVFIPT